MVKVTRKRHGADFKENVGSEAIECALVSLSRSGFYYQQSGESPLKLTLLRLADASDG